MTKGGSVGVTCAGCGVAIVVMSSSLFESVGNLYGIEGEMQLGEHVATDKAESGARLAVADVDRVYTCSECGTRGVLPPAEELFTD